MALLRSSVPHEVFDYQVLMGALQGYRKPRDRISRLLAAGEIVRIKKGLYVFAPHYRREPIVREQLANLVYGPSYVSLESALSWHGLIPERVEALTSVTTGRSRVFHTPLGTFSYQGLPVARYVGGALLETRGPVPFFIATPEKALVDKVWADKGLAARGLDELGAYLVEGLRSDEAALRELELERLKDLARAHASAKVDLLVRFISRLKGDPRA